MLPLLALLPFIVFLSLILVVRRSVLLSITISLVTLLLTSTLIWGMDWLRILASATEGTFVALEILLIVFGALLILESLKEKKLLLYIKEFFESISMDKRVHVVLIAWAFVFFLEGVAGFGAPIIIVVPILIALGFAPLTAVIVAIIGDSVPVIFGAIGLPVTYGMYIPLQSVNLGYEFLHNLTVLIASINILGSIIIPLTLVYVYTRLENKPRLHFFEFIPFALIAGFSASIPAFIVASTVGPELASIVGGICSIVVVSFLAKKGYLMSRTENEEKLQLVRRTEGAIWGMSKAVFPYVLITLLLLLTRLPLKEILSDLYVLRIDSLFGQAIQYSFNPLYSAGSILLFVALVSMVIFKVNRFEFTHIAKSAFTKIRIPLITLILMLSFVQIFMYSGENMNNLESMPKTIAVGASHVLGPVWPLFAPFLGALGSFAGGSATVSNLIFTVVQYETATLSGYSATLILALQGIGAAAGNMIALHNVIAALAVAGIVGKESYVIRKTIVPLSIYLLIMGILGLILSVYG
jgi:lactate permease